MRFAWIQENTPHHVPAIPSAANRLILAVYNIIWWMPLLFVIADATDYRTGTITFIAVTLIRAIANVYRNNVLTPEQAATFPFRSP